MADYFNARNLLPPDLLIQVLKYIPEQSRYGAVLYFREDYYARRNSEIIALFRIYQDDPNFGSNTEIYEALSEQFGLTVRQICRVLEGNREPFRHRRNVRRLTGIRVTRPAGKKSSALPFVT
jgi:hypothetical protein